MMLGAATGALILVEIEASNNAWACPFNWAQAAGAAAA